MEVTDEMVEAGSRAAYGDHFERYRGLIRRALDAALVKAERERATPAPVRAEGEATPAACFAKWLEDGPRLAKAAGCHVGIRVTAALKAEDSLHG